MEPFNNSRPTILCGYGALGQEIARNAKACGVILKAVFDNHFTPALDATVPQGVIHVHGLTKNHPIMCGWYENYNWVICAIRQQARTELRDQLESLGAKHIYHASDLLRAYPSLVALARPGTGREEREDVLATRKLYADATSPRVVESIVQSWMFPEDRTSDVDEPVSDIADIYFPDFIRPFPNEVFVDVGAFDGDTVRSFIEHRGGEYGHIIAAEPDQSNHARLHQYAERVGNMYTFNGAVSDHNGSLRFVTSADQASHAGDGSELVPCVTLDYLAETMNCIPSYVKCDCEGGELSVLKGMQHTITHYMPVIACVCYHKPSDLWELPKFIHEIAPGYRLFLRRYAGEWWESVLYCVPDDRVLWDKV